MFGKNRKKAEQLGLKDLGKAKSRFNGEAKDWVGIVHEVCNTRARVGRDLTTGKLYYWCPTCGEKIEVHSAVLVRRL